MKKIILIFAFIFLVTLEIKAAEIFETMPPGTQLLSQSEKPADEGGTGVGYKYSTNATKEAILDFYQKFLLEDGYTSTGKEINDKASVLGFKKGTQAVAVVVFAQQENGLNIYYLLMLEPPRER